MAAPTPLLTDGTPGSGPTLVLAHGAGATMDSPFMEQISSSLAAQGLYVVRFEFPYMQERRRSGRRRPPDGAWKLRQSWIEVAEQLGGARELVIGGKSMGGRIASMVVDELEARGLVCLGYPFHPPGRPESLRTAHLETLRTPSLIVQGSRDALGSREEIEGYRLSRMIELLYLEDGDHSFKPRLRSGFTQRGHIQRAAEAVAAFCLRLQASRA
jgi:predicted alpha/beta-hydrolase family hydrolase